MFEFIHAAGVLIRSLQDWFSLQPLPFQVLIGLAVLAVLWVLWIVLRVLAVALRTTFRGL